MKLQRDKKLVQLLHDKNMIVSETVAKEFLHEIDTYLEEHGFHIYPTKKEKGTVTFKEAEEDPAPWKIINIEKGAKSFSEFRGRLLYAHLVDANERLICSATLDYILNNFQTRKDIISNYQEAYDTLISFSKEIQKYWESNDRKPSADGEEEMPEDWKYKGKGHKVIERGNENPVQFTPWMKCPVCDGWGKKFDTSPFGTPTNIVTCPCCNGDMVIPMKRESR